MFHLLKSFCISGIIQDNTTGRKIIAVSSNTESLADDQYGEAPLLAFTDDGIWALRMGRRPDTGEPTDKYTASRVISRDVVINQNILQMGKALAL